MAQLAPLAVLAFAGAFGVSLLWHARPDRMGRAARIATADALLVASVLVILRATLPSDQPPSGLDPWTWMPFEDLIRAWPFDRSRGVILGQMAQNVALFVPFGVALVLRQRRVPVWRVTLVSAAFSVAIEVTQGLAGNGRSADVTDVLMNALGGACGWALGRLGLDLVARSSRNRSGGVSRGGRAAGP
jgi:VanZ family protein